MDDSRSSPSPVQSDGPGIVRRASWLLGGRVVGDAGMFVYYLLLARRFGAAGIGDYSFAFAVGSMLMLAVSFGLRDLLTRRVARNPDEVPRIAPTVVITQATITLSLLGLMVVAARWMGYSSTMVGYLSLAFLSLALLVIGITFTSFLEAVGAMQSSAVAALIQKAVIVVPGIVLIVSGASLLAVMSAHVVAGVVFVFVGWRWTRRRFGRFRISYRPDLARTLFMAALPFLATSALWELYSRVDIVMLHFFSGEIATGMYAAAYKVIAAPLFVPELIGIALFPTLTRGLVTHRSETQQIYREAVRALTVLGLAGGILIATAGDGLQVALFGSAFAESGRLIRLMAPLFVIEVLMVPLWRLLLAMDRERLLVKLRLGSVALNVGLNLILIPKYGAVGAIVTSLVSEGLLAVVQLALCRRMLPSPFGGRGLGLAGAGLFGAAVGYFARAVMAWAPAAIVALAAFAALVFGFRLVLPSEVRELLRHVRLKGDGVGEVVRP